LKSETPVRRCCSHRDGRLRTLNSQHSQATLGRAMGPRGTAQTHLCTSLVGSTGLRMSRSVSRLKGCRELGPGARPSRRAFLSNFFCAALAACSFWDARGGGGKSGEGSIPKPSQPSSQKMHLGSVQRAGLQAYLLVHLHQGQRPVQGVVLVNEGSSLGLGSRPGSWAPGPVLVVVPSSATAPPHEQHHGNPAPSMTAGWEKG
jgi:hypothetical protein